jgi:hypothetical protein
MDLVQRTGEEAVLPEMAAAPVETIDVLRVQLIRAFQSAGQRVRVGRRNDKVDVIGHQTIALYGQIKTARRLGQKRQEGTAVVIDEEDVLTVVAPLGHVVGTTFDNYS